MNSTSVCRTRASAARALLALLLLVLATGCRLDLSLGVALNGDGGGELEVRLRTDDELAALAAESGVDPLARVVDRVEALGGPWEAEAEPPPEVPGVGLAGPGVVVRAEFSGPEEFASRYAELRTALDAPEARLLGDLSLVVDEESNTVSLSGEVPFVLTEVAAADAGTTVEELSARLNDVVSYSVKVTTPAPLTESSTTVVAPVDNERPDGEQMAVLPVPVGGSAPLDVTFVRPGLDLVALALQVGVGALAVAAIAGGVLAQRRR